MAENTVQSFFVLLFAVTLAFLWLIRGFLQPIFWAIALGIVVFPMHAWLIDAASEPAARSRRSRACSWSW